MGESDWQRLWEGACAFTGRGGGRGGAGSAIRGGTKGSAASRVTVLRNAGPMAAGDTRRGGPRRCASPAEWRCPRRAQRVFRASSRRRTDSRRWPSVRSRRAAIWISVSRRRGLCAGREPDAAQPDLAGEMDAFPRGAQAGTLLHQVLEETCLSDWSEADVRARGQRLLAQAGFEPGFEEALVHVVRSAAETPLGARPRRHPPGCGAGRRLSSGDGVHAECGGRRRSRGRGFGQRVPAGGPRGPS